MADRVVDGDRRLLTASEAAATTASTVAREIVGDDLIAIVTVVIVRRGDKAHAHAAVAVSDDSSLDQVADLAAASLAAFMQRNSS